MDKISILVSFLIKNWKFVFWSFCSSFLIAFVISAVGVKEIGGFLMNSKNFKYKIPLTNVSSAESISQKSLSEGEASPILKRNLFKAVMEGQGLDSEEASLKLPQGEGQFKSVRNLKKSRLPLILVGLIFSGDLYSGVAMIKLKSGKRKGISSFFSGDIIDKDVKLIEVHADKVVVENSGIYEYIPLLKKKKKKSRRKSRSSRLRRKKSLPESYSEDGFERKGSEIVMSSEYRKKMLTADFTKVLQDAKAEPNFVGRELNGFKLTRIKPDSIYEKSGFTDGDVITEINGVSLVDTGQAIRLLQSLRGAEEIEVILLRNGQEITSNIQVK